MLDGGYRLHKRLLCLHISSISNEYIFANFAVGPDNITSAACKEANCEAGNPGTFVECSGATRRRMNITSYPSPDPEINSVLLLT